MTEVDCNLCDDGSFFPSIVIFGLCDGPSDPQLARRRTWLCPKKFATVFHIVRGIRAVLSEVQSLRRIRGIDSSQGQIAHHPLPELRTLTSYHVP
jgi:hypothetical protein